MTTFQGQIGELVGEHFVDCRRSTAANQVNHTSVLTAPGDYASRSTLVTYLSAHGYALATIHQMTTNDLVYAYRLANDAAGVK